MLNFDHQFLIKLNYVFQSEYRLYFVQEYIEGGELGKLLSREKNFLEDAVIFFAA